MVGVEVVVALARVADYNRICSFFIFCGVKPKWVRVEMMSAFAYFD